MKYCKHCSGPCVMTPIMRPHKISLDFRHDMSPNNIYRYEDWGVSIEGLGYKLHRHGQDDYGVFNHYFAAGIEPILICSFCEEKIPDNISNILTATNRLWNLRKRKVYP